VTYVASPLSSATNARRCGWTGASSRQRIKRGVVVRDRRYGGSSTVVAAAPQSEPLRRLGRQCLGVQADQTVDDVLCAAAVFLSLAVLVEQIEATDRVGGLTEDEAHVPVVVDGERATATGGLNPP